MKRILVTGATGNVGLEVIRFLLHYQSECQIIAGVRNVVKAKKKLGNSEQIEFTRFDFEDSATFQPAFENIQALFLLRPPHISQVERYFNPLIEAVNRSGIKEIIFLSVQGAEKSKVIPHNQIEKLIAESGVRYIFLRPSYFMQNMTTTLLKDIQQQRMIILPAGKAKFNWIDIVNIGEITAILFNRFDQYANQAIEITGNENKSFKEVAQVISEVTSLKVEFMNVHPLRFYQLKKRQGLSKGMIVVMILLHFLPRFQKQPRISDFYYQLTGKQPTTVKEFVEREHSAFKS
ncbi:MAG TPA: NmrA family NAD(P)-binding protein [Prolixibacteraceae bacterium]|nr:NmrA family NAD(P)-binding protein [Prolixibacteraceae bacterium]